jgi:hypothetical protein
MDRIARNLTRASVQVSGWLALKRVNKGSVGVSNNGCRRERGFLGFLFGMFPERFDLLACCSIVQSTSRADCDGPC